jgi:hypothetical protein
VLIPLRQLVDRMRYPRTRADELAALRVRFAAQPSARHVTPELRELGAKLRQLRAEMAATLGHVEACSGCAKGHPEPSGHWQGGHCCGGRTLDIFSQAEVAALKVGGTRGSSLTPPAGDHAGCVFRGPRGCSLDPVDRPTICVRFVCLELRAELRERDDWRRLAELGNALRDTFARFTALREAAEADLTWR